jgi:hypothetical protein
MCNYSGLSFHNRLAFLVPDLDFLEKFQPALKEKLTTDFGQRHFGIAELPGLVNVYKKRWKDPACYQWVNPRAFYGHVQ